MPSAAILAGGHATRFGGLDKSALLVDGRSILDRQVAVLSALTDDVLYVGANPPAEYRARLRGVPDRQPGLGPLAGLDAALAAARYPATLVVACDMPFVTAELLAHLSEVLTGDVALPRTRRGRHPLCACYASSCRPLISKQLAARQLAVQALLERLRVQEVAGDELAVFGEPDHLLANLNTPAEYASFASSADHTR
jgi:molybdopterin-guanine dinucleotide biosynthesis protein A